MAANSEQRLVHCKNGSISYWLIRKPVKNINLRIKSDGSVLISADNKVPLEAVDRFVEQKQSYILTAVAEYKEKKQYSQDNPKKYVSGENYELLGKSLRLKVEESQEETVYSDGIYIFLNIRDRNDICRKRSMMTKWLEDYRTAVFKNIIDEKYPIFCKYGVPYPELKVRHMISQWGTCQHQKGIITLNSRLIEAPRNCIEYVVIHEFVHFIYPNHSKQFWDFVTMLMPDWRERKKELELQLR